MCRSMVDIQSAAAEIRRGKKRKKRKKKEERRTNHSMKIYMVSLLHRATINYSTEIHTEKSTVAKLLGCIQQLVYRKHMEASAVY